MSATGLALAAGIVFELEQEHAVASAVEVVVVEQDGRWDGGDRKYVVIV